MCESNNIISLDPFCEYGDHTLVGCNKCEKMLDCMAQIQIKPGYLRYRLNFSESFRKFMLQKFDVFIKKYDVSEKYLKHFAKETSEKSANEWIDSVIVFDLDKAIDIGKVHDLFNE